MFKEQEVLKKLNSVPVPTVFEDVRFEPPDLSIYEDSTGRPSMYLKTDNPVYFYCTEHIAFLSIDYEELSYNYSIWINSKKFAISITTIDSMFCDDDYPARDTAKIGQLHDSEEAHFQDDCLKGTPITWELECAVKSKLDSLVEIYNKFFNENLSKVKV